MAGRPAGALSDDADELLRNPVWQGLRTEHAALSLGGQLALRYRAEYIPFAGVATMEGEAFDQLRGLLAPGESIYLASEESLPSPAGLAVLAEIPGLQMVYVAGSAQGSVGEGTPTELGPRLDLLTPADVPEMLELKEIAFPGYYGPRAPALGTYYGIRIDGQLVAMAGERLALPGLREVSAVCTHPLHAGRGYAARLIRRLVEDEISAGLTPFLHLVASNKRAFALYERLGFVRSRAVIFTHLRRT